MTSEKDREMAGAEERDYVFTKTNPPVTIRAKSQAEAEAKLSDITT